MLNRYRDNFASLTATKTKQIKKGLKVRVHEQQTTTSSATKQVARPRWQVARAQWRLLLDSKGRWCEARLPQYPESCPKSTRESRNKFNQCCPISLFWWCRMGFKGPGNATNLQNTMRTHFKRLWDHLNLATVEKAILTKRNAGPCLPTATRLR